MPQFTHGHALIIGMGADLPNTVQDATGLADILKDAERCAYPPEQVHLLTNEQATRATVLAALEDLTKISDPQATVLVYFSGHGYRVRASLGEFYYLLPFGYDLNRLFETAIRGDEFTTQLRAIPAQKLLVLLDCCHAGGLAKSEPAGLTLTKAPIPPEAASLLAEGSGRVLIASSQEDELSFAGRPYSAFTQALIDALCGAGASTQDGYVRVADMAMYTGRTVPGLTRQRQHPILSFNQADNFKMAYYAAGNAQAKGLPIAATPEIEPEPGAWRGAQITQTAIGDDNVQLSMDHVTDSTINIHMGGKLPNS